ncbi:MAG TPA: sialidase family protein [Acidimicrobiales bacterium]|nr:sialidase family protein [Acidimicrobiales bacterium]
MKTDSGADEGITYDPAITPRRTGRGRTAALAAAAGVGLALVGIGLAVNSDDDSPPRMEVSAGTNRAVTPTTDEASLDAFNSPAVVASPKDADTLVVAARIDRPQLSAVVRRSEDAGATWKTTNIPLPPGEQRAYAPDLAFDASGDLYAAFVTLAETTNNPTGVWLTQSKDAGASFAAPTKVAGPYGYQPRVLANGSTIHVGFVQASASVEGITNGFGPPPNPVVVATSTDRGATFGQAVTVSGGRERVGAATPFFGINGELMVLFEDYGDDTTDFEGKAGAPTYEGDFALVMARSKDSGATFEEVSVVDDAIKATDRFNPYTPVYPSVAVAPKGEAPSGDAIYVAWADRRGSDWDVFVRRTNDGGETWGKRVQVNAADSTGTHQYLPTVSVALNGRVDVAFLDRSEGGAANNFAAAALATSFDAGATWRTITVSDKLFDSRVGPQGINPETADFGSRLGLVSQQERALTVWTDSRAGDEGNGRQEIYFAPVRIVPEEK